MKKYNLVLILIIAFLFAVSCENESTIDSRAILESREYTEYRESFNNVVQSQESIDIHEVMQFMRENGLYDKYDHVCDLINDPIIQSNESIYNYYQAQCVRFQKSKIVKEKFNLTTDEFISIQKNGIKFSSY